MNRLEDIDERQFIPKDVFERFRSAEGAAAYYRVMPRLTPERLAVIATNLRKVHAAGLLVVAGTDTSVPGVLLGVSSQAELLLLVEGGLSPAEALRAATLNAAIMLGRSRNRERSRPDASRISSSSLAIRSTTGDTLGTSIEWSKGAWSTIRSNC